MAAAVALLSGGILAGGAIVANADGGLEFDPSFDGASIVWSSSPVILSGTSTDPGQVDIYDGATLLCSATPDIAGAWSCTPGSPLLPGSYTLTANQYPSITDVTTFDVLIPRPTVSNPDPYAVPYAGTATYSGTTTFGNGTVWVAIPNLGPSAICSQVITGPGPWSCDIAFTTEAPNFYLTEVSQTWNSAPQQSPATLNTRIGNIPPASVIITTPFDGQIMTWDAGTFLTIAGAAPLGTPVDILIDDVPYGPCTGLVVDNIDANWDCGSLNVDPGPHTIEADQGSTSFQVSIDVQVPAPDVNGQPLTATAGDPSWSVGGSGLVGYTVTAKIAYNGSQFKTCTAVVGTGGFWSCDLDLTVVGPGTHALYFSQQIDPSVSYVTGSLDVEITGVNPPPPLNCVYSPGGGFAVTSNLLVMKSLWRLDPFGGLSEGGYTVQPQGYCNGGAGVVVDPAAVWDDQHIVTCDVGPCSVGTLAPGLYELYFELSDSEGVQGLSYEPFDYMFRVPEAPTISTTTSSGNLILMKGSGTPGDRVNIVSGSGKTLCTATANRSGLWVCSFSESTASKARAISIDPPSGGKSAYSVTKSIPILDTTPPTPGVIPSVLEQWLLSFDGDLSHLKPGDHFSVTLAGIPAGWNVELILHSDPYVLGTAVATGAPMTLDLVVPEGIDGGAHTLQVVATTPLGTNYFKNLNANVVVDGTTTGDPTPEPTDPGDGNGGGNQNGGGDRSQPGGASALTGSIATIADIARNPITVAFASILALALLLLVALPTELLNSSLESNSSRLGRGYSAIDRALKRAQAWFIKTTRSPALAAAIIVTVISIVYGFIDPHFGFDLVSLRLVLSLAIAFFILSYGASWLSAVIVRRFFGAMTAIQLQPTIILFAIVGVIVARILDFSPGFLIGIAIGLEVMNASRKVAARAVMVQLGVIAALSLVAWIIYSLFTPGNDFFGMLTQDTLVATTAEGLTGAMIAIFPLRFLEGFELWETSKRRWVAMFLVIGVPFALIVLPTAIDGSEVRDYGVWIIVLAVFGALSLAIWWIFARADKRDEAEEEREKVHEGNSAKH